MNRADWNSRYEQARGLLEEKGIPTWLLALFTALITWSVHFALPSPGLDVSWWAGLYMATRDGMQFGTEIVFTYGPLGFMKLPWLFYSGLGSIAFVYSSAVFIAFIWALLWTLRPNLGAPLSCLVAALLVLLVPGIELAIGVAILVSFGLLGRRPAGHSLIVFCVAGAAFAGAEALMKLSTGPVIFLVLLAGVIGARAKISRIAGFVGAYVIFTLGFWVIAGQSLGNLPDYMVHSLQVMAGYTEAMSAYAGDTGYVPFMLLVLAATLVWAWVGEYPDRRARAAAVVVVLVVGGAMYKQGVVRMDGAHRAIFFAMVTVLWVAIPPKASLRPGLLVGVALLGSLSVYSLSAAPGTSNGVNPIENVKSTFTEARTLVSSGRKYQAIQDRRLFAQMFYAIEPRQLAQLEGHTVSVDPVETEVAWAYDLDWSPVPVFQNYTAYTPELDQLNADAIESPSGPERILRSGSTNPALPGAGLDNRFVGWDPPKQAIATLCNFKSISETLTWQVLGRVEDRCGEPVPAGTAEAGFDEAVDIPAPGPREVIYARVKGAGVKGLESIRSLLYRPKVRYAIADDGRSYRFLGALAEEGLMLRAGKLVDEGKGTFTQVLQSPTIELTGASGDLDFEFFRMKVRPLRENKGIGSAVRKKINSTDGQVPEMPGVK